MSLVEQLADLDQANDLHLARLLVLLSAFSVSDADGAIEGITKLAKLDFLLRYPVLLERALITKHKSTKALEIQDHERQSVESAMVRYRFGPWDHRYREFINILVAKGLCTVAIDGRKVVIAVTHAGREKATEIETRPIFEPYARRAKVLKQHFDVSATNLMRFIYSTFPEVISLRSNARIGP